MRNITHSRVNFWERIDASRTKADRREEMEKEDSFVTLQLAAEKRGLNNYPSKDNFYSIKMALETLVNWAKIRFKAQFERILIF